MERIESIRKWDIFAGEYFSRLEFSHAEVASDFPAILLLPPLWNFRLGIFNLEFICVDALEHIAYRLVIAVAARQADSQFTVEPPHKAPWGVVAQECDRGVEGCCTLAQRRLRVEYSLSEKHPFPLGSARRGPTVQIFQFPLAHSILPTDTRPARLLPISTYVHGV